MFQGAHRMRVDAKGRLALPKPFRDLIPEGSFISIGPDGNLTLYPKDAWDNLRSVLPSPLTATREQRELSRTINALAAPCQFDQQGRVLLTSEQRRAVGIEPESTVVVAGNQAVLEIWAEDRWDSYSAGALSNFTDNVNKAVTRNP